MLHSRLLRYLDEVARCGSIRKAADRLNVASSAVNRQILALEEQLGQPIFDRLPRKLRLTATGEILIEHVRATLKDHARVSARLDALRGLQHGRVSLATTPGLAAGPMVAIVSDFIARHPRVRVGLRALSTEAIPPAVLAGDAGLGLGFNMTPIAGLRSLMTLEIPFGAVVAPGHPLTGAERVRLANAMQYPLVLAEPGMSLRGIVDMAMARLAEQAQPIVETNSIELMKQLVRGGSAVTFLNPLDVADDCTKGELVFLGLAEPQLRPQVLRLVARSGGALEPTTARFAEELRGSLIKLAEAIG
ncbi:MAG TPA: LysR family transcriptional regulator [Geminicoccaceae bacterium]|nr:LysR family transcriptional regulator [Geminicoccus sp.]HMU52992.1 LysR family transcriptional regulator [Geminicoccaceae bacterium]